MELKKNIQWLNQLLVHVVTNSRSTNQLCQSEKYGFVQPCRHYWFSWGSGERKSEWMGTYGHEWMLKQSWTNPKYEQSTKGSYIIRIIHTTIGRIKEVWSKRLVRLVQDTFRISSDLNESHWFRIASAYVPCLQGSYPCRLVHLRN